MKSISKKFKELVWRIEYALHFSDRLHLSFANAWSYSAASLENINYDIEECPCEIADDDIDCWKQDL